MIQCFGCQQKVVGFARTVLHRLCDPCLEKAKAEIPDLTKASEKWHLPVLFYSDLQRMRDLIGTKNLAWMLDVAPVTIRMKLKTHKGRHRLERWLALRAYRPLWGKWAADWLNILPTNARLALDNVQYRLYRSGPPQGRHSIQNAVFWSPPPSSAGSTNTRSTQESHPFMPTPLSRSSSWTLRKKWGQR